MDDSNFFRLQKFTCNGTSLALFMLTNVTTRSRQVAKELQYSASLSLPFLHMINGIVAQKTLKMDPHFSFSPGHDFKNVYKAIKKQISGIFPKFLGMRKLAF